MWVVGFILLIPGNYFGSWVANSFLWHSSLTLVSLGVLSTVLALTINLVVWLLVMKTIALMIARIRRHDHASVSKS